MPKIKKAPFQFEKALGQLESLVERMEEGDLTLEEALEQFEKGIGLVRQCQEALKHAEQKVQILMEKAGEHVLEPYEGLSESG